MNDEIFELDEKNRVIGHIYKIINTETGKVYIGQTLSHYKNKGKYRPYGYEGRFKSHVSEAISNTKKKQCTLLNNSIRKHGKDVFEVELLVECHVCLLDLYEKGFISKENSMYPNGYNMTKGGKTTEHVNIANSESLNNVKKRGRDLGFSHTKETRKKMSARLKKIASSDVVKKRMCSTMVAHYDAQKVKFLSEYDLDDDYEKYINPVKSKETKKVHTYIIKINGRKLTLYQKNISLREKYNRLKNILKKAYELQNA